MIFVLSIHIRENGQREISYYPATLRGSWRDLSFIVENSAKGSAVIFDYLPESLVNGTCVMEVYKKLRKFARQYNEFYQLGFKEGTAETFLAQQGF